MNKIESCLCHRNISNLTNLCHDVVARALLENGIKEEMR